MDNNLENEQNKIFFGRLKKKNGMGSSQIMNEKNLEPQKGLGGPRLSGFPLNLIILMKTPG